MQYLLHAGLRALALLVAIGAVAVPAYAAPGEVLQPDEFYTDEDKAITVKAPGVLANDSPDQADYAVMLMQAPAHGDIEFGDDGGFTYAPFADFNGIDVFTYGLSDGTGECEVRINVAAINDAPVALNDQYVTMEDEVLSVETSLGVLANDSDVDADVRTDSEGNLRATLIDGPRHGTLVLAEDGSFEYLPDADFYGFVIFTYAAIDDAGAYAYARAVIQVMAANDAPSFIKGANVVVDEDCGDVEIPAWARDIHAGAANEAGQYLTFEVTVLAGAELFEVAPWVAIDGTLGFTAAANAWGTATLEIVLVDSNEAGDSATSAPQGFEITINPTYDAPSFVSGGSLAMDAAAGEMVTLPWATEIRNGSDVEGEEVPLAFVVLKNGRPDVVVDLTIDAVTGEMSFTVGSEEPCMVVISVALLSVDTGLQSPHQSFVIVLNPTDDMDATMVLFAVPAESAQSGDEAPAGCMAGSVGGMWMIPGLLALAALRRRRNA